MHVEEGKRQRISQYGPKFFYKVKRQAVASIGKLVQNARLGVKAFWALSLPGKVAPVTAGKSIKTTIYNILTELGV